MHKYFARGILCTAVLDVVRPLPVRAPSEAVLVITDREDAVGGVKFSPSP
mgnify:FL=1